METIVIIHKNAFLREGIRQFINKEQPQLQVNVYDKLTHAALAALQEGDLVMLDASPEGTDHHSLIETLLEKNIRTAIWLPSQNKEYCKMMLELKCAGYFCSQTDYDDLKYAFSVLLNGKTYVHHDIIPHLYSLTEQPSYTHETLPSNNLTRREWEVLQLLADGMNNKSISVRLYVSESTVKNHLSSIMRKLKVNDRTAAVIKAIRNNWVS
ncbi:response regulator transcription factor [Fictibacillus iocasae]|uniref:Response regulator transcription factor n=1 Tax=Fictibacillus iocasae TaxID=2715437 RepID=A0ABW2NUF9_9BACL